MKKRRNGWRMKMKIVKGKEQEYKDWYEKKQ